jgi:uncharacterized membrane protein YdbT with pleckstrin-like domain
MNKSLRDRKPLLVVKPSVVNALFPLFFKNLFFFLFLAFGVYFLFVIVNVFVDLDFIPSAGWVFLVVLVLTFLSISLKLLVLRRTKYVFYETNADRDFDLIVIKRRSVVYNRITNISLKVSLWDRLTGAGHITLHTGDDEVPDLVMSYVKNPGRVENLIYSLIHKQNTRVTETVNK